MHLPCFLWHKHRICYFEHTLLLILRKYMTSGFQGTASYFLFWISSHVYHSFGLFCPVGYLNSQICFVSLPSDILYFIINPKCSGRIMLIMPYFKCAQYILIAESGFPWAKISLVGVFIPRAFFVFPKPMWHPPDTVGLQLLPAPASTATGQG